MTRIGRVKEFLGTGLGVSLTGVFVVGNLYWLWLATQFGKFWMYAALLFVPTAFVTGPVGAWALIFGTPVWLTDIATDTTAPGTEILTEEQLRSFSVAFNETLPQHITSDLTLLNLSIRSGPKMVFEYSWEDGQALDAYLEDPEIGNAAAVRRACGDSASLRVFLDDGATLQYIAHKSDGTQIYDFEYDVSDCPE